MAIFNQVFKNLNYNKFRNLSCLMHDDGTKYLLDETNSLYAITERDSIHINADPSVTNDTNTWVRGTDIEFKRTTKTTLLNVIDKLWDPEGNSIPKSYLISDVSYLIVKFNGKHYLTNCAHVPYENYYDYNMYNVTIQGDSINIYSHTAIKAPNKEVNKANRAMLHEIKEEALMYYSLNQEEIQKQADRVVLTSLGYAHNNSVEKLLEEDREKYMSIIGYLINRDGLQKATFPCLLDNTKVVKHNYLNFTLKEGHSGYQYW